METLELIRALMELACPDMSTIPDNQLILFDVDDGGELLAIPFKIFKTWKKAAAMMIHPDRPLLFGDLKRHLLELIFEWCIKHQDDVYDPRIDGPNFGITCLDAPSKWDKKFLAKISKEDLTLVMGYCKFFGIKPLLVLLVKELFRRYPDCGSHSSRSPNPVPGDEFDPISIRNPKFSDLMLNLLAPTARHIRHHLEIVCGDDGSRMNASVKSMKKWRNVSKDFVFVDDHQVSVFRDEKRLLIPYVSGQGMQWIVKWGMRHDDEPDIDDVSGLPNLGIASLDVPDWDKKFINTMTRDDMKMALRDCSRLNLQPLIVVLLKMMFQKYDLVKVFMKDVRDLSKKITIVNPNIKK